MSTNNFDIIIAGGGLSGLSLAWHLAKNGYKKKVLIVDSTFAPGNKKTWCFWDSAPPPFPEIIYKSWRKTYFSAPEFDSFLYMNKYQYHCIRESDFKEYVLTELKKHSNFTLLEESVLDFSSNKKKAALVTKSSETFLADYIFQSIFQPSSKKKVKYPLIQHFYGLEIKTSVPVFDPGCFTIMDFDESFSDGIAFTYVLPFLNNRALVEYTVFSRKTFEKKKEYKEKVREYLKSTYNLERDDYEIKRKEYGEIPMSDKIYPVTYTDRIFNIGTSAGLTKASTGYTFLRVQKFVQELARILLEDKSILVPDLAKPRFKYYDLLLLHILDKHPNTSVKVFRDLFKNNSIDKVFDFLSEDTNFLEDLKIMSSVPPMPFIRAISRNPKL